MNLGIVLLGPPGSGKGTQAKKLSRELGLAHISTGDLLRSAVSNRTELGLKAKEFMDAGELVPDELVIRLMQMRMSELGTGFILDGFPRNMEQARRLESITEVDRVINLEVPEEELIKRLTMRRTCRDCGAIYHLIYSPPEREGVCDRCGGELYQRSDDTEGVVRQRLQVYRESTLPLIEHYANQGKLISIDGTGDIDEVFMSIVRALRSE